MNKKAWGSAFFATSVVAAGISVSSSTLALFSDDETSAEQSVAYGTLDLVLGGAAQSDPIEVTNGAPPQSGYGLPDGARRLQLTNDGSLPGKATFTIRTVSDKENGCNEPEAAVDSSCGTPGNGEGELDDELIVVVYDAAWTQQLGSMKLSAWNAQGDAARKVIGTIGAGQTTSVIVQVAGYDAGNHVQSDSAAFVVDAKLEQIR
jgi:predicted ribosomally synthesized peptide with SipW-like signal peptide